MGLLVVVVRIRSIKPTAGNIADSLNRNALSLEALLLN